MKHMAVKASCVLLFLITTLGFWIAPAAALDEVAIGLNIPLAGPYQAQGQDLQQGYELAIETINANGGVLGMMLKLEIRDSQANGETARQNTVDMIWGENAAMISGGLTTDEALAMSTEGQEQGVIFIAGLAHADAVTGHTVSRAGFTRQSASRHAFRWNLNAWMSAHALATYLMDEKGRNTNYYYISEDNSWGLSLEDSMRRYLELRGADTLGSEFVSDDPAKFAAQLTQALQNARKAKADVLVLNLYGPNLAAGLKQAHDMGLTKRTVAVPLLDVIQARELDTRIIGNIVTTTSWYWKLAERFPGSKTFVDAFNRKYGNPPGLAAAAAWVAVMQWADAVTRAGDVFADDKIILALEGSSFTLLKDAEQWRDWDHQAVSSVFILKGKQPKKMTGPFDLFDIAAEMPGSLVMRNREQNPVSLEPLVIEE
jgi:ABC-type branched-subunit amino acid transport system substrate-binding protein